MNNTRKERANKGDTERSDGGREGEVNSTLIKLNSLIHHCCNVYKHNKIILKRKLHHKVRYRENKNM